MTEINPRIMTLGRYHILCDAEVAADLTEEIFQPKKLEETGRLTGKAQGRGDAWFISVHDRDWVLRHYRRGGLIGRFVNDCYFGFDLEKSRAWSEWRILAELYRRGLPVPRPIAAAITRGLGFYHADLITEKIAGSRSLADLLAEGPQPETLWKDVGTCLRRFHDQGAYHADLNARNILIDNNAKIFLIDFDRGSFRSSGAWQQKNLLRLKRSLFKIRSALNDRFYFEETDWATMVRSYRN